MTCKIIIIDDQQLIRYALKSMLKNKKAFEAIGEAENGVIALDLIKKLTPDLIIFRY